MAIALWPRDDAPRGREATEAGPRRPGSLGAGGRSVNGPRGPRPLAIGSPASGLIRVTGMVTDRRTHAPVPDVEVVFADGHAESSTVADGAGRYSLVLPAGHYRPFVQGAGVLSTAPAAYERLPGRPRPEQVAVPRVELPAALELRESTDGVDLEVDRSGKIRGRVVDRHGAPIAGAIVRASTTDAPGDARPVLATDLAETDRAGGFELEVAATRYQLDAFHDRYGGVSASTTASVSAGETVEAEITMQAGCVISGRVVRADGRPAAHGALERSAGAPDGSDSGGYVADGALAADGSFVWSTIDEQTLYLRAWPWASPPSPARRFDCAEGVRYTDVVLVIPDASPDLSGRVVTADGRPVPFAFVDVGGEAEGAMSQQERADANGDWAVYALPAGPYRVATTADGAGAAIRHVRAPAQGVELRMSGTIALTGRVQGITDGPLTLTVRACVLGDDDVAPQLRRAVSVVDGHYRVDGVPACQLGLQFDHRGRSLLVEAPAPTGSTTTLDLDFSQALTPDESDEAAVSAR